MNEGRPQEGAGGVKMCEVRANLKSTDLAKWIPMAYLYFWENCASPAGLRVRRASKNRFGMSERSPGSPVRIDDWKHSDEH